MVSTDTIGPEEVVIHLPRREFRVFQFTGDSMMNAHIVPHSKLLVDTEREPQNGDVVVVEIGKKFTVRFYKYNEHKKWLLSANRKYADMIFDHSVHRISVVIQVITDASELR